MARADAGVPREVHSAVVVAHKFLTQPDDELVAHLNARETARVLHICHSFSDAPDRRSSYSLYAAGKLVSQGRTRDFAAWPEPLIYLKEMLCTLWWVFRLAKPWQLYVGMDGLSVTFGNALRALGRVQGTVYWAIDYVPENRFASAIKNAIYRRVNRGAYLGADEVWDLSPRMAEARERFGAIKPSEYRRLRIVPYGVWLDRIPHRTYEECEKREVVFMGHLLEKQGVQLAIRALPLVRSVLPEARLKIIGGGSYRERLEQLAADIGVAAHCTFLGKIADIRDLEREVAASCVAVAPYIRALDTWTVYADPGKVKTYLACGVPVVLTDLPWNAAEIARARCGVVVSEDVKAIGEAIVQLMQPETNRRMRANAREYAKGYAWPDIFRDALSA
jgi:glycosyltransferase involved in cell wall biosynthesis